MRPRIIIIVLVFTFLLAPLFSLAQTSQSRANRALEEEIQKLFEQIKALQDELNRFKTELGVSQPTPEPTKTPLAPVSESEPELPEITRTLSLGARGDDVRDLQQFLARDKTIYPEGLITSYLGPLTFEAIKRWQERNSITPEGIFGPKSRAKLQELTAASIRRVTPKIDALSPESGSLGTYLTLTGTGFTKDNNEIFTEGRTIILGLQSPNGTYLNFTIPSSIPCKVGSACPLKVTNVNGISNAKSFRLTGATTSPTPTPTATSTPTPTATTTPTISPIPTATSTPTISPTPTATTTPPVATSTEPLPSPPPGTAPPPSLPTPTPTPDVTPTPTPSTGTSTPPTPTPTSTPTPTLEPTPTPTPSYGSALNLSGVSNVFGEIWFPGSNGIILGGGLNFSTQVGVGSARQYGGIFVTSYSIQGTQSNYLTQTNPIEVRVTGPAGSVIEAWDLESLAVIATNITNPGSPVTFTAQPNRRYGGFGWYANNSQTSIAIFAVQSGPTPDTQPPSAPGNFSAVAASCCQINLAWSASTDNVGVSRYRINRNGSLWNTTTSLSYSDTSVSQNSTYYYAVFAEDAAGNISAPSSTVTVTTPSGQVVCSGLTLVTGPSNTNLNGQTTFPQGDTLWYRYACSPGGTAANVTVRVVKPDGTITTYNSSTNVNTNTFGFSTSNLVPGNYTLQACFDPNCDPTTTASVQFTISGSGSGSLMFRTIASILEALAKLLFELQRIIQ